jgi:hypothetical protein
LIKNLSIDFNSKDFTNPSIQKFYAGLQALALNEDEPDHVEDLLEPDYEGMKVLQPVVTKFRDAFFNGHVFDWGGAAIPKGGAAAKGKKGLKNKQPPVYDATKEITNKIKNIKLGNDSDLEESKVQNSKIPRTAPTQLGNKPKKDELEVELWLYFLTKKLDSLTVSRLNEFASKKKIKP